MPSLLEGFRPTLPPHAQVRTRADGTAAVHDPEAGRGAELGADQATLLALIDGRRTLAEVAEAHYTAHGFVSFNALRDLLRTLATRGLLANNEAELRAHGLVEERAPLSHRAARTLIALRLPAASSIAVAGSVAWLGAAAWLFPRGTIAPLLTWDVLWAPLGAAIALSGRELLRSCAAVLFGGGRPQRLFVRVRLGLPFVATDGSGVVLLERAPRAVAGLFALLGSAAALCSLSLSRGVAFGALVVLVVELCPFLPTTAGRLLATFAGRVDLREHARAYLERRFLRRVTSAQTFEGEGSLIWSALLSLAWLGGVTRLLLTWGAVWVVELLEVGVDEPALPKAVSWVGAGALALLMPAFLFGLFLALWRAVRSLLPVGAAQGGQHAAREAQPVELAAIPLFARLSQADQEALAKAAEHRSYPAGAEIVRQGAPGDAFFAIREGQVLVEAEAPSGLRCELARLGPGDGFGETALLEQEPRMATVRALVPTSVVVLSRAAFDKVRDGLRADEVTTLLRATAALRQSAFFGRLSPDRLSSLALRLSPRRARANEVVVQEGEEGDDFFLVAEGTVEVVDAAGGTLATLSAGAHFGELALLRDVPRTATVRASSDVLLLALDKATFLQAMAADLSVSSGIEALAATRAGAGR